MGVDGKIVAFPVYVRGRDDGHVIEDPTLAAMQHHLEAIDVENEEYEAWDAQGIPAVCSLGQGSSKGPSAKG